MIQLSFPTRKLGEDIIRVNQKLKDVNETIDTTVLGVTNTDGITVTGNKASNDLSKYIVIKGRQFAYNPYRVNVGSIGLTADNQEGLVSPAYVVFKTKKNLIPEFLLYYLKSSIGINLIRWYGNRGGVRDSLRFDDLCKIDIPDLTIKQQLVALEKIKVFEEQVVSLNIEIKKQEMLLNKYKGSILNEAIQGKLVLQDESNESASMLLERIRQEKERLIQEKKIKKEKPIPKIAEKERPYELPKGWEWVRFGDVIYSIESGKSPKCEDRPAAYPEWGVLKVSAVSWGKFNPKENKFLPTEDLHNEKYEVYQDDFLMTRANTAELVARSVIVESAPQRLLMSDKILRVKFFNSIDSYYINIVNLSSFSRDYYAKVATGTSDSMKNVSRDQIKNLLIPLPPFNEQKRIVEKVNQLMILCDELEINIEQSKQEAEKLMKAVLQEAFTVKEEVLS